MKLLSPCVLFVLFFTLWVNPKCAAQEKTHPYPQLIENLDAYCEQVVDNKSKEELRAVSDLITKVKKSSYGSWPKAKSKIRKVFYSIVVDEEDYSEYLLDNIENKYGHQQNTITKEDYDLVRNNQILFLLIFDKVLSNEYPFKLVRSSMFYELVIYNIKQNDRVADIGAGTGNFGLFLTLSGLDLEIYLTEVSQWKLEFLKKRNADYTQVDSTQLPTIVEAAATVTNLESKFDKIIIRNTLHHIVEYASVLADIKMRLAPGGILYVTETLEDADAEDRCEKAFSKRTLNRMLRKADYHIIEKRRTSRHRVTYACRPK